jgi:hypothetical protein
MREPDGERFALTHIASSGPLLEPLGIPGVVVSAEELLG